MHINDWSLVKDTFNEIISSQSNSDDFKYAYAAFNYRYGYFNECIKLLNGIKGKHVDHEIYIVGSKFWLNYQKLFESDKKKLNELKEHVKDLNTDNVFIKYYENLIDSEPTGDFSEFKKFVQNENLTKEDGISIKKPFEILNFKSNIDYDFLIGVKNFLLDNYSEAIEKFDKFLGKINRLNQNRGDNYCYWLAAFYLFKSIFESNKVINDKLNSPDIDLDTYLKLNMKLKKNIEIFETAQEICMNNDEFEQFLKTKRYDFDADLIDLFYSNKKYDKCLEILKKKSITNNNDLHFIKKYVCIYNINDNYEKILRKFNSVKSNFDEILFHKAQISILKKDFSNAIDLFERCERLLLKNDFKKFKNIYHEKGKVYVKMNDFDKAKESFFKDIQYNPHNFDSFYELVNLDNTEKILNLDDLKLLDYYDKGLNSKYDSYLLKKREILYKTMLENNAENEQSINHQFFSFDLVNDDKVNLIYEFMNDLGFNIWFNRDRNDYIIGETLNERTTNAIENSNIFIVFLTPEYLKSKNCLLQLKYALKLNKFILTVYLKKFDDKWSDDLIQIKNRLNDYVITELTDIENFDFKNNNLSRQYLFHRLIEKVKAKIFS